MKILFSQQERKVLDILFGKVSRIANMGYKISDFGITQDDPSLHVSESFVIAWTNKLITKLDSHPAVFVAPKVREWYDKFLKFLGSMPKGTLAKQKNI